MRKRNLLAIALCEFCKEAGFCRGMEFKFIVDTVHEIKQFNIKEYLSLVPLRATDYRYNHFTKKYIQTAFDAFHQEDYETALLNFRVIESECQSYIDVLIGLSLSCFMVKDYEKAIYFMERSISISHNPSQKLFDFVVGVEKLVNSINNQEVEFTDTFSSSDTIKQAVDVGVHSNA